MSDDPKKPEDQAPECTGATDPLTDRDRAYLQRRPAVEAAMMAVDTARAEVAASYGVLEDAKRDHKANEAALEAALNGLIDAEKGFSAQAKPTPLFDDAAAARAQAWEAFLSRDLDVLALPDDLKGALRENAVHDLRKLAEVVVGDRLESLGFKTKDAHKIAKSYDVLLDAFEADHGAEEQEHPDPGAIDFDTTFPTPIHATEGVDYDTGWHRNAANSLVALDGKRATLKASIESGTDAKGRPLTPAAKAKLVAKMDALVQELEDAVFNYSEVFGTEIAARFKAHCLALAEKKAALKGGL
jgi:hypothetical protein